MTKDYLEKILSDYGVPFTSTLADRLLKEFQSCKGCRYKKKYKRIRKKYLRIVKRKGTWIEVDEDEWYGKQAKCSNCKHVTIDVNKFCPKCGSKMEGDLKYYEA